MRESAIESSVCKWARSKGLLAIKLSDPSSVGKPDRMFVGAGKVAFVEFKRRKQKPTALQEKWLEDLRRRGFAVEWFDSRPLAVQWLRKEFSL